MRLYQPQTNIVRIENDLPGYHLYQYRGLFTVINEVCAAKTAEDFLHESFIDEMTKQLTPQIISALDFSVTYLKQRDAAIKIRYIDRSQQIFYSFQHEVYFQIQFCYSYTSSFIWTKYYTLDDSRIEIDPYKELEGAKIKFEIVYRIPNEVASKAYDHMISSTNPIDLKTSENMSRYYKQYTNNHIFDEWILDIKNWFSPPQESKKPGSDFRFSYEIIGATWPDILIRLYMKKKVDSKIREHVFSVVSKILEEWSEKQGESGAVHDIVLYKEELKNDEKNKRVTISTDFGNADPNVLINLLNQLNASNLDLEKIVFE